MVSTGEKTTEVKVFLVDSGRTVLADVDNVCLLPDQLHQESQGIKQLAFLFQLRVKRSFICFNWFLLKVGK